MFKTIRQVPTEYFGHMDQIEAIFKYWQLHHTPNNSAV